MRVRRLSVEAESAGWVSLSVVELMDFQGGQQCCGAVVLVVELSKAFKVVVVWGVVKVLWLCSKSIQGILWVFCHERRVNFGKNISVLLVIVTAILPGCKWSVSFLRILLRDAMWSILLFFWSSKSVCSLHDVPYEWSIVWNSEGLAHLVGSVSEEVQAWVGYWHLRVTKIRVGGGESLVEIEGSRVLRREGLGHGRQHWTLLNWQENEPEEVGKQGSWETCCMEEK